uniref:Uncharacterized protein n=1 Tax=Parascaris univalens TaxID=6257 RepID=A0A915BEL6_PARUN
MILPVALFIVPLAAAWQPEFAATESSAANPCNSENVHRFPHSLHGQWFSTICVLRENNEHPRDFCKRYNFSDVAQDTGVDLDFIRKYGITWLQQMVPRMHPPIVTLSALSERDDTCAFFFVNGSKVLSSCMDCLSCPILCAHQARSESPQLEGLTGKIRNERSNSVAADSTNVTRSTKSPAGKTIIRRPWTSTAATTTTTTATTNIAAKTTSTTTATNAAATAARATTAATTTTANAITTTIATATTTTLTTTTDTTTITTITTTTVTTTITTTTTIAITTTIATATTTTLTTTTDTTTVTTTTTTITTTATIKTTITTIATTTTATIITTITKAATTNTIASTITIPTTTTTSTAATVTITTNITTNTAIITTTPAPSSATGLTKETATAKKTVETVAEAGSNKKEEDATRTTVNAPTPAYPAVTEATTETSPEKNSITLQTVDAIGSTKTHSTPLMLMSKASRRRSARRRIRKRDKYDKLETMIVEVTSASTLIIAITSLIILALIYFKKIFNDPSKLANIH